MPKHYTSCIKGANVTALSTHLPVITTSAPKSRALAMGPALTERNKGKIEQHREVTKNKSNDDQTPAA